MKKIINNLAALLVISILSTSLVAQVDPSYRNNQFNILMLNPAQSGASSTDDISVLTSKSLIGFTGAPRTLTASGNFRILENIGLGITALNDQNGPMSTTSGAFNLAYHLKLDKKWKMSVGIKASVSNLSVDLPALTTTQNDPNMKTVLSSGMQMGTGWGALLYSKSTYFGIAQPNVSKRTFQYVDMSEYVNTKGFLTYAGTNLKINNNFTFRPSIVVRYIKSYPVYTNLNAFFTYRSKLDFGVNYQIKSSIGVTVGFEINKKLYFGYSYSTPTTSLNRISTQAHEFVMRIRMNNKFGMNFQGPRFFN
jgi:type IX secretion system PorP/SprF family membrane protein